MSDHWHLRTLDWLSGLPKAAAHAVRRASVETTYAPGGAIFGPTRRPEDVYFLEQGLVRIFRKSPRGHQFTLGYVRPGEIFGEVSVIGDLPRASFAEAKKRSKVLRIPKASFLEAARSSNAALFRIIKKVGQRLVTCQARAEDLMFFDAPTRLARTLLRIAQEFGERTGQGHMLGLHLTQGELATLIGTTRQTVSEALRRMMNSGLVSRAGRELVLTDLRALRELARLPPGESARQ